MKLIIIGPMASGKSVVGKKLSKRMNLDFFDTDESIENKAGASISSVSYTHLTLPTTPYV